MNKKELQNLVLKVINSIRSTSGGKPNARLSSFIFDDLEFDSLDTSDLKFQLIDELGQRGYKLSSSVLDVFWINGNDRTVKQLIDYIADDQGIMK